MSNYPYYCMLIINSYSNGVNTSIYQRILEDPKLKSKKKEKQVDIAARFTKNLIRKTNDLIN